MADFLGKLLSLFLSEAPIAALLLMGGVSLLLLTFIIKRLIVAQKELDKVKEILDDLDNVQKLSKELLDAVEQYRQAVLEGELRQKEFIASIKESARAESEARQNEILMQQQRALEHVNRVSQELAELKGSINTAVTGLLRGVK